MIRSPEKKAKERKALRMAVMISQIGICMMVPVFFCVFLGRWCSEKLGHPLIFLFFLIIGILAGFRSCWQMISRFTGLKLSGREKSPGGSPGEAYQDRGTLSGRPDHFKRKEPDLNEESDGDKMDKMVSEDQ